MTNASELEWLNKQLNEKKRLLAYYKKSNETLCKELTEIEVQVAAEKAKKLKSDQELADVKNEEAMLKIQLSELKKADESAMEQKLNESLLDFSVTDVDDDVIHFDLKIAELTKKAGNLEAEVKTLLNDGLMCKQEINEIDANIAEVSEKQALFLNEIDVLEKEIFQFRADEKALTVEQDQVRQELMEAKAKYEPKGGAERGTAGIAQVDSYIKQIRMKLLETRDQKRQIELQHNEISQRLDYKRRHCEVKDKSRTTEATIALLHEVYAQLMSFTYLKLIIDSFYISQSRWTEEMLMQCKIDPTVSISVLKVPMFTLVSNFRFLLEMTRDAICAVLSKVPSAYQAELQQFNEVKQRYQQKMNSAVTEREQRVSQLNDLFQTMYDCLSS